jgi:hypothetical protein
LSFSSLHRFPSVPHFQRKSGLTPPDPCLWGLLKYRLFGDHIRINLRNVLENITHTARCTTSLPEINVKILTDSRKCVFNVMTPPPPLSARPVILSLQCKYCLRYIRILSRISRYFALCQRG